MPRDVFAAIAYAISHARRFFAAYASMPPADAAMPPRLFFLFTLAVIFMPCRHDMARAMLL